MKSRPRDESDFQLRVACNPSVLDRLRSTDEQLQIEPMAASIEAKGVLQNLLVMPAKKPRGTYEVFDGGRRWRARW